MINDPDFVWRSSAATDITITWRKYGWKPIQERTDNEADRIRLRQKEANYVSRNENARSNNDNKSSS